MGAQIVRDMHPLAQLLFRRILLGLVTLWAVLTLIFLAFAFLPGDLAEAILGQEATPQTIAAFRRELGLDLPLWQRYLEWMGNLLQGDLGKSLESGRPVTELIGTRLQNTIFLAALTAAMAVPLSLVLGIAAALYRNSLYDRMVNAVTLASLSFPDFFAAYVLIYLFALKLQVFPSMSALDPQTPFWVHVYRCLLPALTLTLIMAAHMMRMTRAAIVNLLASPYIEMAYLKGVHRVRIILWHVFPNALPPIINVVVLNLAYLVVGVVVVEVVFVYPGLGQLLVNSVSKRDVPIVQACSLVFAATYVGLNLLADILSIASNPRLLHPR
jgi:peptide/nickel transport system permease protein